MITPDEAINRIRLVRQEIIATRTEDAIRIAADTLAAISDRVINEGRNAQGNSFGVYSPSYQKWRAKNNLTAPPFPNVNFKRTTEMWNDTQVVVVSESDTVTSVRITPVAPHNIDKMIWNVERFGEILETSDQEDNLLAQAVQDRYISIFQKYGLL